MAPDKNTIADIISLASTLNQETDELNAVIERLERQLGEANIGVAVWLVSVLNRDEIAGEPVEFHGTFRDTKDVTGWNLGYCKIDKTWHIAVRECRGTGWADDESFTWTVTSYPIALVNAPRIVRVEAAAHLDPLLAALKKRMEAFVGSIQRAKKIATA